MIHDQLANIALHDITCGKPNAIKKRKKHYHLGIVEIRPVYGYSFVGDGLGFRVDHIN